MLGFILVIQVLTGLLLRIYYTNTIEGAFDSVQYIMFNVNHGWFVRLLHFNGASLLFLFLYIHFFKGLFFFSYRLTLVWVVGMVLLILCIVESFSGYVLVWSQMSFWAAVVITRLLTVVPFVGQDLVYLIWGGYCVSNTTLKFFFSVHFLIPLVLLAFLVFHIIFLHKRGRTSKILTHGSFDKVNFYPYFWVKDMVVFVYYTLFLIFIMT